MTGRAWVFDPSLIGEREVKGQIKLRFTAVSGKPIVCSRSMKLLQKQVKREYKTLDNSIQVENENGEIITHSVKCADIDKEIPELMGVSKAILHYVIFCHQEESNWPLEDKKELKKKFDNIFASTRYTKALESIKKQFGEYKKKILRNIN